MTLDTSKPVYVITFAVVFSAAFTAVVVSLQVAAEPTIKRNDALRDQRALVKVFRLADDVDALSAAEVAGIVQRRVNADLVVTDLETGRAFTVYRAYKDDGTLKGYAFVISGSGFWAPIKGLLSVTPDRKRAIAAVFVEQSETPGLGGRITEDVFQLDQFDGLNVSQPYAGEFLYVVRERRATDADTGATRATRSIEAITGATQTSLAVVRFINKDLAAFQRAMNAWEKTP